MEEKRSWNFLFVTLLLLCTPVLTAAQHGGAEEHHESVKNTAVIVILGVILLLTLFFEVLYEFVMEFVEHRHLEHMKKIIEGVFREMTILGFISLLLFMTTRFGFIMDLNNKLFGIDTVQKTAMKELADEGEPVEAAPTVLYELFEEVHIFVFIIMVTFLLVVIGLLVHGLRQSALWRKYDSTSFDDLQQMIAHGEVSNAHVEYWILRYKFMNPSTVFVPKPEYANFGFAEYCSERLCDLFVKLIEIPPSSWICLCIFALLIRPVMEFSPLLLIVFLFLTSAGLMLASILLYLDSQRLLRIIRPDLTSVKNHIKQLAIPGYTGDVSVADLDRTNLINRNTKICQTIQRISAINRQEALFLFTAKGVVYQQKLMQLLVFLHTLAITCIIKITFSTHTQHTVFVPYGYWTSFVPLALAISSLAIVWPFLLSSFTLASSVGFYADRSVLARSSEKVQLRRLARNMQILQFLYHKADAHFAAKDKTQYDLEMQRAKNLYDALPKRAQKSYQDMFHAFSDLADVPRITRKNLQLFISGFGIDERVADCKTKVEEWFEKLDVDKSNDLTYPEFTTEDTVEDALEQKERETERLRELFISLDKDNDGFVTQEELIEQLSGIKPAVSKREARILMADIARGHFGEMVRPENLFSWVQETEERAKVLMPQVTYRRHHH